MNALDEKIITHFEGKVVRKDLTKLLKGNAVVPTYVLEYLLGQHCSTNDEEIIAHGIEKVKDIIAQHFVHRDEAEKIKSFIKEQGSYRIIDKISVKLNDRLDRYEVRFSNLGLLNIPIADNLVKANTKLLSEGVWCLINIAYVPVEERNTLPWIIESVKPIQISNVCIEEYAEVRKYFTLDEWMGILMQSIGLNPEEFSFRSKLIQLSRLIPFTENNYNLIELGPKGTGKSHIYSEMSPHGILLSGGEVSKAKLFVNNTNGNIGLVGYWDVIAYDEFAGNNKKVDSGLVDIMKNYMANKSFSRGTDVYQAEASMAFVGNTDRSVQNMFKNSDLFISLPKQYYDTAFLDRVHLYVPGWEVSKLRNELFTDNFGFIVDYLAEILKNYRKKDFGKLYLKHFSLSDTITTRDKTAIEKTFSGLVKILFPDQNISKDETKILLDFAVEGRKRVKLQLQKMDETFNDEIVNFEYFDDQGSVFKIATLEEIEYGEQSLEITIENASSSGIVAQNDAVDTVGKKELLGFTKSIRENQSNISYDRLFGLYLENSSTFLIQDPYIRMHHQFRNLLELCSLIYKKNTSQQGLKIHLVTWNDLEYQENSIGYLGEIQDSLSEMNIQFTYEFKESIHDRYIACDNGWRISLGRGLDIWQKNNGKFDIAEVLPEKRKCKEFELIVVKH